MPSGKNFFGIGSRQQRDAGQRDQTTPPTDHTDPARQRSIGQKSEQGGHQTDTAVPRDQDASLHEAKKPSVFKQLFQKCE